MRPAVVLRYVGLTLLVSASFMLLCSAVGYFADDSGYLPLLFAFAVTALVGIQPLIFVPTTSRISSKEGYAIVVFSWLAVCFFGMIPYVLWGGEFDFSAAWFESVSGFSTTGATILNDIERLPKSLLLWRSFTHWIGGMGVVVFALVVLPSMGKAQMTLSRSEVSSIARQDFRYRSRKMLRIMATMYLVITLVIALALWAVRIPIFDAINISFSTVATGGFAITNQSIASYDNVWAEIILIIGMLISSLHFGLLFGFVAGRPRALWRSPELRFFLTAITVSILAISVSCLGSIYTNWFRSLRHAAFQVLSIVSTTGFASADFASWTPFSLLVLLTLSTMGGCSGSTAGGIKVDRIVVMLSSLRATFLKRLHPRAFVMAHVGKIHLETEEVNRVLIYILSFYSMILIATLFLTAIGNPLVTSFSSSLSCMTNVGPAFGVMGSFDSYSFFSPFSRVILSLLMLLGRLEIFGLLIVFSPSSWK